MRVAQTASFLCVSAGHTQSPEADALALFSSLYKCSGFPAPTLDLLILLTSLILSVSQFQREAVIWGKVCRGLMPSLKRHASPSNASCRHPQRQSPVFFVFPSLTICFLGFCVLSLYLPFCRCLSVSFSISVVRRWHPVHPHTPHPLWTTHA